MVFKICEGISCSSFSVQELDVIVHKKYFPYITMLHFGHSVPASLANLVVEVGTRHCHQTLLITSMRGCVMHNDLWPWPISSRSFSHEIAVKLIKCGISCGIHSTACAFWVVYFHIWHKWLLAWEGLLRRITLIYIFKVTQAWFCSKTAKILHNLSWPHYSMYSYGWILSIFGTNDHYHKRVWHILCLLHSM